MGHGVHHFVNFGAVVGGTASSGSGSAVIASASVRALALASTGVSGSGGPAAVLVALIVDVWNNTIGGIAIWDITEVAVKVVVGHGVVAISI